jgi:hypothetical protein
MPLKGEKGGPKQTRSRGRLRLPKTIAKLGRAKRKEWEEKVKRAEERRVKVLGSGMSK